MHPAKQWTIELRSAEVESLNQKPPNLAIFTRKLSRVLTRTFDMSWSLLTWKILTAQEFTEREFV